MSSSKSSSSSSSRTYNTDDRVAVGDQGIVLQNEGSNSTIMFEDVNADILLAGFDLIGDALTGLDKLAENTLNNNSQALNATQELAENLFEEKNTPSSDNMRNIIFAVVGGLSVVGIAYFWSKK